ncbi:hypothetical protein NCCP2716_27890 [Sporosarcina sp. NCCP-2716]|uniref:baseplate J/gp47 family protein n=1 Tax=Sporosarcina sp. NCCP-2716 TaxID=2943679 RepID=UPI00203EA3D0|nr:baseplate J/gp47 family protein [Sporosarcina sp. NCCP-2716]GKV70291.1 hypothetical protein NCCP2716_27890 [Sporosarcina sp. NCCP-2716]
MGLDRYGFKKKGYADLLAESHEKYRELFGQDVNLASYTPLGIISRVQAFFYARIWETIEKVYNSRFIRKADGVSLDYHGGDKGLPRNPALPSYVELSFTGEPGHLLDVGEEFTTEGDVHFVLLTPVALDFFGKGTGEAVSADVGDFTNVLANTITTQIEPSEKVTSVTNPLPSVGGADLESDLSYKRRLLKANESNGKATATAVETALQNTPGVRSANVVFNRTLEVDSSGNPPKSLHAFVLGGTAVDIADSIFNSMGATTETVGASAVPIDDLSGNTHVVRFDYAQVVEIYLKVNLVTNSAFQEDGARQVQDKMIAVIGGVDSEKVEQAGLSMGGDVILSRLYGAAYQVQGIEDVKISIGKLPTAVGVVNISILQNEVAVTGPDHIEVIVNA